MEFYQYVIAIVGSFLAGAINTLAGNGSVITLSLMTEMIGLPGNVANGTNRIGLFTQSAAGAFGFWQNGRLDFRRSWAFLVFTSIGAIIGALVAVKVSNEQFLSVFRFLMVFMLFVILFKPERWLRQTDPNLNLSLGLVIPMFLALGFYGGFIQMGMGIFFVAVMVLTARYSLVDSNAIKVTIVGIYTIIVILIFQYKGLIDWKIGALIAIGQTIGGYLTAVYASKNANAARWAHRILILAVVLSVIKMYNLHEWVISLF
ncbi:MAG: sulfite exporter TauE/SafE family protein [Saprospiraceae bacterium]|nr:sulfite exporter TauE/SafE family protein [Saprospiraceae bacterium]